MYQRNVTGNTRTKIIAGAVLLSLGLSVAGSAMSTDTFGGGATLPAGAYVGFNFLTGSLKQSANTSVNASGAAAVASNSLFGAWSASSGNKVSYCQTGSGNGKKIFDNSDGTTARTSVSTVCDGTIIGFRAPTGVAVDPYFAGSDAPMSSAEYDWFTTGGKATKYGEPTQFPAVAGSIAIIFRNADVTSTLNLTDAQLCSVLNGTTTNWNQLGSFPSKPIKVAFRSDGSGTTFSLSNHLTAACSGTASQHFVTDQAFSAVVAQYQPTIPSTWIGASGNPAVVDAVNNNDGAIGYAESANLRASAAAGLAPNVKYTTVNGKDPYADFPASINVGVVYNQVITGVNASTGAPTSGAKTPLVSGSSCLGLVNPTTYANVTSRYPIMAVSYLLANYQGNGTDLPAVQGLIGAAYVSGHPGVTTIGANTGYSFVNPAPAIDSTKIAACVKS